MVKKLANEFVKNIKIMFRNWAALSLLIIAPIVLILIIGYTFSSETLSDITIGIVSQDRMEYSGLQDHISGYATLRPYRTVESCVADMVLSEIHICVGLEGLSAEDIGANSIPTGKVTYYYDNSRKKVSLVIIQELQDFFGLQAEQISVESAESIIGSIQNLVAFINERKDDIRNVENESMAIKLDLIERKAHLIEVRDSFDPTYYAMKDLQDRLNGISSDMQDKTVDLSGSVAAVKVSLDALRLSAGLGQNMTNMTETQLLLRSSIDELESQISGLSSITNASSDDIRSATYTVNSAVEKMDTVKATLDTEINKTDEYIVKIDRSVVAIEQTRAELDSKLEELSKIQPDIAQKLAKPILWEYSPILKDAKNIQLSFPLLAVLIIMFISLLFSNIATLMEIHDKAYLRNLISPVNDLIYMIGVLLTSTVIIFFQILVLFAVAQTRFNVNIAGIFLDMALISLLLIVLFVLIGMIFAYLFRSTQSSILMTTFSTLIFFLLADALSPVEAMPDIARFVSTHNPIVIGEFLMRQVQLFETPIDYLAPQIMLLIAYIIVLFVVLLLLAKYKNRKR